MEVPLPRSLVFGSKGPDVIAVKRALSRAGFMEWGNFTNVYGVGMRNAVYALHKKHGRKPAGYGPRAHNDLEDSKAVSNKGMAFDPIAVKIMEAEYEKYHVSPEDIIRGNIVAAWRRMYASRGSIRYSQHRPFLHGVDMNFRVPAGIDCSGTMTLGYDAANAKSPNVFAGSRLPYNGTGYTGTLMAGGTKCRRLDMEPGDMVMYGFTSHSSPAFPVGSPTHVAGWEGDSGLHVYSMGSYPMGHYPHNYRTINCFLHFDVTP
jgi:peptidoglycan hydrolase-like protein with peptidoglycan-binding domain